MIYEVSLLIFGFFGLWIGSELVISGAKDIANHFKLSNVFIGLTVLAIGTDLPELMVSATGAFSNLQGVEASGLVVGNIIGSCITQILLILGILGTFGYYFISRKQLQREGFTLLGSLILFYLLGMNGELNKGEGIAMILFYLAYILSVGRESLKVVDGKRRKPTLHFEWSLISLAGGLIVVLFSSELVINNSLFLAETLNVSQTFVGLLLIGLGTSLPELAVSITAAFRKAYGLSIGNLLGSNIFDTLFVTGVGATISGLKVSDALLAFDIPFLFVASLLVLFFFARKRGIQRKEAIVLLGTYAFYVVYKVLML